MTNVSEALAERDETCQFVTHYRGLKIGRSPIFCKATVRGRLGEKSSVS